MFVLWDSANYGKCLLEASKYIPFLQENNGKNFKDFEDLRGQNGHLENQIRALEKAKRSGNLSSMAMSQSDLVKEDEEESLEDIHLLPDQFLLTGKN